jgi:hypothetical protein
MCPDKADAELTPMNVIFVLSESSIVVLPPELTAPDSAAAAAAVP